MKKLTVCMFALLTASLLMGCGENAELKGFKDQMGSFYENITGVSDSIDAIDPEASDAVDSLLSNLDAMSEQFKTLSEMEIPEEFSNIEGLADDAATYMEEAVALYNNAYSNGSFDENTAAAAAENYSRAMKRLNYIASLLQGKTPEGEGVTVTTEDEASEFEVPEEEPIEE